MGKKNAVFSQRETFKAMYTEKFGKVNLRENGKLVYKLFYNKNRDEYYCYMKVPSENTDGFYYDVVVKLSTDDNALRTSPSLSGYTARFFSNDPAFVFTYMRVFLKNDMLVVELKSKASKTALKKDPVQRNAYETPGYVKSLYFAYLYMKRFNLFTKSTYIGQGDPYNKMLLLSLVTDVDKKIEERQEAGKKAALARKKAKQDTERKGESPPVQKAGRNITRQKAVNTAKSVKTSKVVNGIRKSNMAKKK